MKPQTDAIKSLLQEVGWMIHDLISGEQIDNEEEERLVALHNAALKE